MCRDITSIEGIDDGEWIPSNDKSNNIKTKVRKSKRIERKLKWKTKKYIYECSQCMEIFKTDNVLIEHERKHNQDREQPYNYKCGHCDYYDLFKDSFETHNIIEHDEWKPYQCNRCNKQFKHSNYLDTHIKSTHWKRKNYKCNVCDASFYAKNHLKMHSRTHLSANPFKCKECGKEFKRKCHLSERPFECDICNKKFKLQKYLRQHQTVHISGVSRTFECDICGKSFKHNRSLHTHKKKCS